MSERKITSNLFVKKDGEFIPVTFRERKEVEPELTIEEIKRNNLISKVKDECNYRRADTRDICHNCVYVKYTFSCGYEKWQCMKPENELMMVSEDGICDYVVNKYNKEGNYSEAWINMGEDKK